MKENRRNIQKKGIPLLLAGLLLLLCCLSGCALGVRNSTTSVSIDENGRLTEEIVEDRDDESYTEEELKEYISGETELYNRGKDIEAIRLNSCMAQGSSVQISLSYASAEDYAAFNQVTCFAGTLQEAEDAGYEVERTWLEPNGAKGDMEIIRERFKEWKVFIVSEPISVKVPDKILYASDNVRISGRLTAVVQTVMNTQDTASSSEGQTVRPQVTTHPLATVADRFAYIIYK